MSADYERYGAATNEPAENIEVPIESWPDGSIKTSVRADRARLFLREGLVWGEGVAVRQLARDGSCESELTAENCLVDRKDRTGWAKGLARVRYRDVAEIEGRGVFFDMEEQYVRITSDTRLTARGDRLESPCADYDHRRGVAMFEGGVKVQHDEKGKRYDIASDRAFAFIEGTNDLKRIVALGNVKVAGEGRSGFAARAVYQKRDGKVTLYGEPGRPARLVDSGDRKGALEGARIVFWTDSEQVEVLESKITVETSGGFTLPEK